MQRARVGVVLAICVTGAFGCGSVQETNGDAAVDAKAGGDAAVDAMPDAERPVVGYDVGFVDDFTLTPDITSVFGFVAVVNTGTSPLKLSTASVVTFLDDNAGIDWVFAKEAGSTAMLAPGRAGGFLSLLAKTKVLANGVVTEPVDDQILSFSMSFPKAPVAGASLHAQAVIAIDGLNVTLPITINVVAGGDVQFNSARRLSAKP